MPDNIRMVTDTVDLVYSEDDKAWYFQKYDMDGNGGTTESVSYKTEQEAMAAWPNNVVWFPNE